MIVIRLMGGIGNQMFQYAFGNYLAIKNKTTLKLDLSLLEDRMTNNPYAVFRNFELDKFKASFIIATPSEINRFNSVHKKNIVNKVFNKVKTFFIPSKTIVQNGHAFDKEYMNITDDHCVVGRWQSESFFSDIKEFIKKEFEFKIKLDESNAYFKKIITSHAVAVHVRRGDYVSNKLYAGGIGALNLDYYLNAVDYLKNKKDNLQFFIFSDEIAWCKKNMKIDNAIFVEQEKEFNKPEFDLQLISKCNYQIISNSTFSWWGAWLSEQEESIIIAPRTWARKEQFVSPNIIPDRWVKIDNGFETLQ